MDERERSALLRSDLSALGMAVELDSTGTVAPQLAGSPCQLLGVLYVLEGSTLGGRMVARLLLNNLGITSTTGSSSFNPYLTETRSRWVVFSRLLDAWARDHAAVVAAACETFSFYDAWILNPVLSPYEEGVLANSARTLTADPRPRLSNEAPLRAGRSNLQSKGT